MKLSDLVKFHIIALFMQKFHNKLSPSYFDTFFFNSVLIFITTIHEVQQINLIICLKLEQTMEYLMFTFKDQRYGTPLGKI